MINLEKYKVNQSFTYGRALQEVKFGFKRGDWMWYIFPQIIGLGYTEVSNHFAIKSQEEAKKYYSDDLLRTRLLEISNALLEQEKNNVVQIFGEVDAMKLRSSMTLFEKVDEEEQTFKKVLERFFNGERDPETLRIWDELGEKAKVKQKK